MYERSDLRFLVAVREGASDELIRRGIRIQTPCDATSGTLTAIHLTQDE